MNASASLKSRFSAANRVRLLLLALGLAAGAGVGFAGGAAVEAGGLQLGRLSWSDLLALLIAAVMVAAAAILWLASLSRRAAARVLAPAASEPASPARLALLRGQAGVLLLSGLMLAAPVLATLFLETPPFELAVAAMTSVVALMLLQSGLNLSVWVRADETTRRAVVEAVTVSFWTFQGALFLWAAAEKLGLAPPLSSWDIVTLLLGLYLVLSSVIAARAGLA